MPDGQRIKPIKRLEDWLQALRYHVGIRCSNNGARRLFACTSVASCGYSRLLKHYAETIGLNPDEITGHALRVWLCDQCGVRHARLDKIMEITRHSNPGNGDEIHSGRGVIR